ncbi:MAG: MFS transporter [Deltaproteobacteria bacterium]|nr:MFS transporter [Deltaproteobacteria bacterium]
MSGPAGLLRRVVRVEPGEGSALGWSFAYFFSLLAAWYVLRPVREEMGIQGGLERLPWAFTAVFLVMLAAVPAFSALVARVPRSRAIPAVYGFFLVNLLAFWALLGAGGGRPWLAGTFFVWASVFNLFVVSVFWSYMADLWDPAQGKRLFGFISAGGSAGAVAGPALARLLVSAVGVRGLLLVAAGLLALATLCAGRLSRWAHHARGGAAGSGAALGGGPFSGFAEVARSSYLLALAGHMLLITSSGTVLYLLQQRLVAGAFQSPVERTAFFATVDLVVNVASLAVQAFATGPAFAALGVGVGLLLHPALSVVGLLAVAASPTLGLVAALGGLRRVVHYGLERPAREVLFTVLTREEKYKAKSFIDTVLYRAGDALGGWGWKALGGLGLALSASALSALPLALAWLAVAHYLRRRHAALEVARRT